MDGLRENARFSDDLEQDIIDMRAVGIEDLQIQLIRDIDEVVTKYMKANNQLEKSESTSAVILVAVAGKANKYPSTGKTYSTGDMRVQGRLAQLSHDASVELMEVIGYKLAKLRIQQVTEKWY